MKQKESALYVSLRREKVALTWKGDVDRNGSNWKPADPVATQELTPELACPWDYHLMLPILQIITCQVVYEALVIQK